MTHAISFPLTGTAAMPMPLAVGNLDAYIASVNRIPLLTEHEEQTLARKLRDEGDVDAARQLVLSHLRVVVSIARGYLGYGLPHGDLIQEGNVGLMKAVKRFDPDRGVRLVSFAIHWIKAEIHEYVLKNWRMVKIATTKAQRKLFFNLRSMRATTDTMSPEAARQVAKDLGVKPEEVMEMDTRFSGGDVALEAGPDDDDHSFAPIAYLTDNRSEPTRVLEARARDRLHDEGLGEALDALDARSRRIVETRWLADEPATLNELAAEYGVSAERIRQIEVKALQKMKGALAAYV
ncbi:MAG TPA: RNA polymerase sigma factor RpoH [Rhodocyclaceae bacterium]|nr:RNA polymerase sigma factor RpoH [Rhodocyclaceae bacterium]